MKTKFNTILEDVIKLLNENLPTYLTYHNARHTLYVVDKAEYIAKKEGVSEHDLLLIKIAALYHDIGFINSHINHEEEGCKIAKPQLQSYGYSNKDIEKICGMIMATKIPQNPKNLLKKILADADLEYIATNRFEPVGELLYEELDHIRNGLTKKEWKQIQIEFLLSHNLHTNYCKRYKSFRKKRNLEALKG
ncbi:HD domain-containing protein [Winogradskyella sp.]|uniref:HD domain-containing protein n=1 Tax=Winogradskyella sp. TaxID=1883156 RepID=UPI003F6CDE1A